MTAAPAIPCRPMHTTAHVIARDEKARLSSLANFTRPFTVAGREEHSGPSGHSGRYLERAGSATGVATSWLEQ